MNSKDLEILNFTVKTKNSENDVNLADDLKIEEENINEAFCEQPAKFAWWATVAAQAQALADHKKLEVEKQEEYLKKTLIGELDAEVRRELEMNGEKVTETKVVSGIYIHPRYLEHSEILHDLKSQLLELQEKATILSIAKESMNQRKDMLISLGAQIRQDFNNAELTIKQMSDRAKAIISKNK